MHRTLHILWILVALPISSVATADTAPPAGLRQNTPDAYALVGARIVIGPGEEIESGTVVIREGKIASVTRGEEVPAGARHIDLSGKVIYPGFIDAYSEQSVSAEPPGPGYWNEQIRPQQVVAKTLEPNDAVHSELRSQGIGARLVAPRDGIFKGQSALVLTSDEPPARAMIDPSVALHIRLTTPLGRRSGYPTSSMGAVALARQACCDAEWYQGAMAAFRADPALRRPEANFALETLGRYLAGGGLVIADAPNELFVDRADRFAREFNLRIAIRGSGNEYRRLDEVRGTQRPVIVPLDFPEAPDVAAPDRVISVSLEELMHWHLAPENPGRLAGAGVKILLSTHGLDKRSKFLSQLRQAVNRGLSAEDALRALTVTPAEVFGVEEQLGTVEVGKIANLIVADGDLLSDGEVLTTWVGGKPYAIQEEPIAEFDGKWNLTLASPVGDSNLWRLAVSGEAKKAKIGVYREWAEEGSANEKVPPEKAAAEEAGVEGGADAIDVPADREAASTEEGTPPETGDSSAGQEAAARQKESDDPRELGEPSQGGAGKKNSPDQEVKSLKRAGYRLTGVFSGKKLGSEGTLSFAATLVREASGRRLSGSVRLADGTEIPWTGTLEEQGETNRRERDSEKPGAQGRAKGDSDAETAEEDCEDRDQESGGTDQPDSEEDKDENSALTVEINYPLGAFGREKSPEQEWVAFTHATVWTCGDEGILENATVVVESGKITAVGRDVAIPEGAREIDCTGKHLSPGIIDCHSHAASDGGMNEMGEAVTAEVRIADFVDPDDMTIYRQLAGGVTAANLLHGSGNPIGGQSQVVKFRWGESAEAMKVHDAPPGIKFALGENPKRPGGNGRYPLSRMGVDELIVDALGAALAYRGDFRRWERDRTGLLPRRDLELEAILEILEGKRWIHCHSYRQSEVLAFLRTLELYNIRVGTLQHILEGYKLTPELVAHGAMSSCFSDWWAYKFEVYDAIPHNGALMHQAGIVVSFNSDNAEMGRRLNQEAAKACKYGGVSAEEALKFVTLNVAKQLRIDHRVGSLTPGKDADIVVWSGPPLSNFSRCEQTWIDGRRYFDIESDRQMRSRDERLRAELIQAVLAEQGE